MTEPADDQAPAADLNRTRRMSLPPVPGRRPKAAGRADEPTDELPPPPPRDPTGTFGPWQPLQPRVVARHRSRWPWVVGTLVLLVVVTGVVVFFVYR